MSSGSPIPIITMFVISRSPAIRFACRYCSWISWGRRLRVRPRSPDAQNAQAAGQPIWELTQRVRRSRPGMRTHSTGSPSSIRTRSFVVPSGLSFASATSEENTRSRAGSAARRSRGRSVISANVVALRSRTHARIWRPRNTGTSRREAISSAVREVTAGSGGGAAVTRPVYALSRFGRFFRGKESSDASPRTTSGVRTNFFGPVFSGSS